MKKLLLILSALFFILVSCSFYKEVSSYALIVSSEKGHENIVNILLKLNADINMKDNEYGYTALMLASSKGHTEIVNMLLNNNADVNIKCDNDRTALIEASVSGHTEIVNILLAHNADINVKSYDGRTALIRASQKGYEEMNLGLQGLRKSWLFTFF